MFISSIWFNKNKNGHTLYISYFPVNISASPFYGHIKCGYCKNENILNVFNIAHVNILMASALWADAWGMVIKNENTLHMLFKPCFSPLFVSLNMLSSPSTQFSTPFWLPYPQSSPLVHHCQQAYAQTS